MNLRINLQLSLECYSFFCGVLYSPSSGIAMPLKSNSAKEDLISANSKSYLKVTFVVRFSQTSLVLFVLLHPCHPL